MELAHRSSARSALATALLSFTMAAVAGPQSARIDKRLLPNQIGHEIPLKLLCAHPFENHGTYRLGVNVAGSGASSDVIPAGKFLQVNFVQATLKDSAPVAGDIGVVSAGEFGWHHMRVHNGAVEYNTSRDDALYADGNTLIKFVAYREHGFDHAVSGDYVMRGCIVDALPPITTEPRIEVPYIPKTHWQSGNPIESKPQVNKAPIQPSR